MNVPRLSIIMSVFNGAEYLHEAISSIQTQSFRDWEFLIMDDGSTDETSSILKKISDPRIRYYNQENSGLTVSLNRLLMLAKGVFVARQDADDISYSNRFEHQLSYLDKHPDIGLLGTWADQIDHFGEKLDEICPVSDPEDIKKLLPFENPFIHASIVVRKDLIDKVKGYRDVFKYSQDYDLVLRISEHADLANLRHILCGKRHTPSMVSISNNSEQQYYAELARKMWRERSETGTDSIISGRKIDLPEKTSGLSNSGAVIYHKHLISSWIRKGECGKTRREIRALLDISFFEPYAYFQYLLTFMGSWFLQKSVHLLDVLRGY